MPDQRSSTQTPIRSVASTQADPVGPTDRDDLHSLMLRSEIERASTTPDYSRERDALAHRKAQREREARAFTNRTLIEIHNRTEPILNSAPPTPRLSNQGD